jgi:N-acetylglucosamine kinase-like BadF-type ATPase
MCVELERTFSNIFTKAKIEVASDLLGAARGFWGHSEGVICVLGTGASCCAYDGQKIIQQSNSLGYIMGDEGGGADIGKRLLRKFFYGELSDELTEDLRSHGLNRDEFLKQVYRSERPAAYLADFVLYLSKRKETSEVQIIIREAFQEYIDHHIRVVRRESMGVGFVGSVAYLFSDILEDLMIANHLPFNGVLRYPIEALCEYHK